MKTIEWILTGALILGIAEVAKGYITAECVSFSGYVRMLPNEQQTYNNIRTWRCYDDTKTRK